MRTTVLLISQFYFSLSLSLSLFLMAHNFCLAVAKNCFVIDVRKQVKMEQERKRERERERERDFPVHWQIMASYFLSLCLSFSPIFCFCLSFSSFLLCRLHHVVILAFLVYLASLSLSPFLSWFNFILFVSCILPSA